MATAGQVMAVAKKYIGTKESPSGSNNVVFNTDYYGHPVSGADYPWCCTTIWDVFRIAGASNLFYDGRKTASCQTYEDWALSKGLNVGKDSGVYGDIATMDFGKGKASHIGFILRKNADGTYQTIEGNTSLTSQDNGGAVMERTRSQSVIRYIFRPKYTKEDKMIITPTKYINEIAKCAKMYKNGHYKYGDSHAWPPCADGITACDRGAVARPLYNLGYKDQPRIPNSTSGITVNDIEPYLHGKKGWKKITKKSDLKAGDIIVTYKNGKPYHCFTITKYNPKTDMCDKYDFGSQARIDAGGFFSNVKLIEWNDQSFYAGFRVPSEPKRLPTKGTARTIESAINKGYCLDIAGASMDIRANANLYKKNGTPAQQFIIEDVKSGYVRIINKKSGLVLDAKGGKAANGTNVQQYEWNGTNAQLWKMRMNADMTVTFESAINNGYVLDVKGGKAANKQNVQLYKNNGTKAQRWSIIKA